MQGFAIDPAICRPEDSGLEPTPGTAQTQTFTQQRVAAREEKQYGPFRVASGTLLEAKMQSDGSRGDPDLYVRFGTEPQRSIYDCRPFLVGADETCSLDVPSEKDQAFVMLHGYRTGGYNLTIIHTPPAQ